MRWAENLVQTKTKPGQLAKQKEILKPQPQRKMIEPTAEEQLSDNLDYFNTSENYQFDSTSAGEAMPNYEEQYSSEIAAADQQPVQDNQSYYEGNDGVYLSSGDQGPVEYYDQNQYQYGDDQQPVQYVSTEPQGQYADEQNMNMQPDQNYVVRIS